MPEMDYGVDLNLFATLNEIYAQESLTEAGRVLHLSQPAVSHALSRLRTLFNDPLFVRQGNRMVPTPLTRSLMPSVHNALRLLGAAVQATRTFDPETADVEFRLGFRDLLEALIFPDLWPALDARAPNLRFSSIRVQLGSLERDIATGKLDLVIDARQPTGDQILNASLGEEPLVVVLRQDHPMLKDGLTLDAYIQAKHVLVTLSEDGPEWVDQCLEPLGLTRNVVLRCQHYFAGCRTVAQTDFISTIPRSCARMMASHLPLVVRPAPVEIPALDIRMYWHQTADPAPAHRWLRDQMQAILTPHLREIR